MGSSVFQVLKRLEIGAPAFQKTLAFFFGVMVLLCDFGEFCGSWNGAHSYFLIREVVFSAFVSVMSRKHEQSKGIPWKNSASQQILLDDLIDESLPIDEEGCSTEEAWEHYGHMPEFASVPYWQFEKQLKEHRKQVDRKYRRSMKQYAAFQRDRERYPVALNYDNGRPIFRHSEAYQQLKQDVYSGAHRGVEPSALRHSNPVYHAWGLEEFTQRIYQMERQWKFVNYLEKRRAEKEAKKKAILEDAHKQVVAATVAKENAEEEQGDGLKRKKPKLS